MDGPTEQPDGESPHDPVWFYVKTALLTALGVTVAFWLMGVLLPS
jgi:hypothetical protein